MMDLLPLSAEHAHVVTWRDARGTLHATVICKATYALQPGTLELAERQLPIALAPHHHEDGSLWAPSDLAPGKRRCDVLVVGHAHAPRGHATAQLDVGVRLAEIDKTLLVVGARVTDERGSQLPPAAFRRMPLRHHLAPTGRGGENPVGVPEGGVVGRDGMRTLPSLVWPNGDAGLFACFAPIAPGWPTRQQHVGTAGLGWIDGLGRGTPMPPDLDLEFFQSAPADQQIDFPRGDEALVLRHLHAQHPQLVCHLPGVRAVAYAKARGRDPEEVSMRCDTVWINTDDQLCSLTWRGSLALHSAPQAYRVLTTLAAAGDEPGYDKMHRRATGRSEADLLNGHAERGAAAAPPEVGVITETELPHAAVSQPALPFQRSDSGPPPPRDSTPPPALANTPAPPRLTTKAVASAWAGSSLDDQVRPIVRSDQQGRGAAGAGVLAAMDAARSSSAGEDAPAEPRPSATGNGAERRTPLPAPRRHKLLWFDPEKADAVRAVPELGELLSDRELRLIEQGLDDQFEGVAKDRGDLFEVLVRAEPTPLGNLQSRVDLATDEHGMFEPPLLVVAGELTFPFDPIQRLRATVTVLTPLSLGDKQLRPLIEEAEELLEASWLEGSHDVADQLVVRLEREAGKGKRAMSPEVLGNKTEKLLLEQRAYQERKLYGASWLRSLLAERGQPPVVCYLPASLRDSLPLYARFAARLLVELDLREDQAEASPLALKALAVARTLPV